jgi:hypothetical protein
MRLYPFLYDEFPFLLLPVNRFYAKLLKDMLFTDSVFIGIDPTAGKQPFVYVAIDANLNLVVVNSGVIDEVLAFAAAQNKAFIGVCAPKMINQGLMRDEKYRNILTPRPNPGRFINYRVVDYMLIQHNIRTPGVGSEFNDCPAWMKMGFHLYQRLEELGYKPYPGQDNGLNYIEVYPHASYSVLIGKLPFPKNTLEGRLQRQLILFEKGLKIPDPMRVFEEITRFRLLHGILPFDEIYSQEQLDALVAAYTVLIGALHPEETLILGDSSEGQVLLPVPELKERYS